MTVSSGALFFALLLILLVLPDALLSVSLQLSFTSTLGILCFAWKYRRLFSVPKRMPRRSEKSISRRNGKSWLFGFLRRIDDAIFAVSFWIFVCLFDFFQFVGTLGYFFAVSAAFSRWCPWHHFRAIGEHRPETGGMADRLCISNWRSLCSNPVRCAIL